MSLRASLSGAGLSAFLALTVGHAEVLVLDSALAIDGVVVASDDPPVDGFIEADVANETQSKELEVQSDLGSETLPVTVANESFTWVTTALSSLVGFGR